MSSKKKELLFTAMKRTGEWISSQDIPDDVTVHIGEASFPLHKFLLTSKCGYIRKLVSESNKTDLRMIEIPKLPGGPEAFELVAKFCYGINFEMTTGNIAMLRCVAEYLEMTEEYSVENLVSRTEAYLNEVALKSLSSAVSVLQKAETLFPISEEVKLVSRCVDAIAYIACKESQFCVSGIGKGSEAGTEFVVSHSKQQPVVDWWAEDLAVLRIDTFQRVVIAMMARGFKHYALGPLLMLYAQKSLRGLEILGKGTKKIDPRQEHEKRVILETIVSLLPKEKNTMSVSFLSTLLRAAIYLETTVACRLDLEKRMALQLGQAVLDDLLIPSYYFTGDTIFDVDTVQRIMMNYLECELNGTRAGFGNAGDEVLVSAPVSDMERVGNLMESYLSEIASDRNLTVPKFIGLAELIPEQSRVTEDGIYRAIDIYLKAHPTISEMERKKVCSLMDCQKLSREACAHAAQNDRLPVQTVVQVLYYEQQRLRDATNGSDSPPPPPPVAQNSPPVNKSSSYNDEISLLRRENQDLKLELLKMKMKLKEIEKSGVVAVGSPSGTGDAINSPVSSASPAAIGKPPLRTGDSNNSPVSSASPAAVGKPPLPRKSFISTVSKKLGRLTQFGIASQNAGRRTKPNKDRRHSIS